MVYINIPYVPENNRIDKDLTQKELQALDMSDDAKWSVFQAIYNLHPRGVLLADNDLKETFRLEKVLSRLGVPYRQSEEPEFS